MNPYRVSHKFIRFDDLGAWEPEICSDFPKITQLPTAVTFCLLNRFQYSWYLGCLAWAETFKNGIYHRNFWILPTHRVPNVKRISEKSKTWNLVDSHHPTAPGTEPQSLGHPLPKVPTAAISKQAGNPGGRGGSGVPARAKFLLRTSEIFVNS